MILRFSVFLLISYHCAFGQFSPGELSKYHSFMEGTSNCTQCHELRKKTLSSGCVDCHSPLQNKMDKGLGYHADKTDNCGKCHSDHNGREFELVYWEEEKSQFDHNETGYALTGNHVTTSCDQCHKRELINDDQLIEWASKYTDFPTLDRTYLGLSTSCIDCHEDIHKSTVSTSCENCHNTSKWSVAIKEFDHSNSNYPLSGRHRSVECEKCHFKQVEFSNTMKLTGLDYNECISCHVNVHKEETDEPCESCHGTDGWEFVREQFNHDLTAYPLVGAHSRVECQQCHIPHDTWNPPVLRLNGFPYSDCGSCHMDVHKGTFGSNCEQCHGVDKWNEGLKPFDHDKTNYPLTGKHKSVLCRECHKQTDGKLPPSNSCLGCHDDRHDEQMKHRLDGGDCGPCHDTNGWLLTTYSIRDHLLTGLPLEGAHLAVPCIHCHIPYKNNQGESYTRFVWDRLGCISCHEDIHRNQFNIKYRNACDDCHGYATFNSLVFDHAKTDFPLDGKHIKVPCEKCHNTERDASGSFIRYIPIKHQCQDCHTIPGE